MRRQLFQSVKLPGYAVMKRMTQTLRQFCPFHIGKTDGIERVTFFIDLRQNSVFTLFAVGKFIGKTVTCTRINHDAVRKTSDSIEL